MKKTILIIAIFVIAHFIYGLVSGYRSINQNKYGKEFNAERNKLGLSEIPESFVLTQKPINTFLDYYSAVGIYTLEYTTSKNLDSGLVKKRIDVDENTIGIIREYSFHKKGNDTIVDIDNYYK